MSPRTRRRSPSAAVRSPCWAPRLVGHTQPSTRPSRPRRTGRGAVILGAAACLIATAGGAYAVGFLHAPRTVGTTLASGGLIPYRGTLAENGVPLESPSAGLQFSLFDAAVNGNLLWGPETQSIPVLGGAFTVQLGSSTIPGPIPDEVLRHGQVYVQVSVNGVTLQGRQQLMTAPYSRLSGDGVPPGTIVAFGGASSGVPTGWLLCDGSPVAISDYPGLYSAIGKAWGSPDAQHFGLPMLLGVFLRGLDPAGAVDLGATTRTSSLGGAPVGPLVGSFEIGEFASHSHGISDPGHGHNMSQGFQCGWGNWTYGGNNWDCQASGQINVAVANTTGITVNSVGGVETRPVNAAVNYLIKT